MHAEKTSDIDKDFSNALALLHSTAENSAEKLRRMLDACIEKKHGRGKTLAARMPRRFLQSIELHDDATPATRTSRRCEYAQGRTTRREMKKMDSPETTSLLIGENIADRRAADVEAFEEHCNDEDVPRISIPDEGLTADGNVCKICNGAKLGALILLECQECQEAYHPLCHQPPIVDVDVYDPRFVWRCRLCIEKSATSSKVKTTGRGPANKVRQTDGAVKETENTPGTRMLGKRRGVFLGRNGMHHIQSLTYNFCLINRGNHLSHVLLLLRFATKMSYVVPGIDDLRIIVDCGSKVVCKANSCDATGNIGMQLRDSPLFVKDKYPTNLSQKTGLSFSSTQTRKRVGSKLSVRALIK
ncbi:integrator complex subunit 12-like [Odontomachus brunneus]|uniref:integrator complex subunit 12-like n=1 Tax=Odontomachus brunneus TaxID=486640 RepID=UPI0013F23EE1|nr:integrator complex subunit 12-like [Odontomachus brunneus]